MASNEFDNSSGDFEKNDDTNGGISMKKAVLYSLLLPGLGEHYTGHKTKAKYFFAVEAMSWIGYFTYRTYANWKEDDMIRYAAQYANAQLDGKDDTFQDMVGFYDDIEQYNTIGRVSDPDRPYLYDTPENHWHWATDANREAFRSLKNRAREADRRTDFMIGVAIVNRIISVIDTIRDVKRSKRNFKNNEFSDANKKFKFDIDPLSYNKQVKLTYYTPF
jgi:hypothetical protein